ncbi:MAG: FAD-dependent oxidoreductase [Candidatus Aenigmatarchaeota archaeon]|nr:MAG: FAD-dependent oxidoreductase [Candidatus Aenigmarchaeota archaeon]
MNKEVLILGAGPAGMAAAFELHKAGKPFIIIEKNKNVGGLARTLQYGEFRTDTGPHRFFSQNQYLYDFIEDLLGERWIKVDRLTRFYINGKFFLYPIELKNALLNVGLYKAFRILFDYLFERIRRIFVHRNFISFEEQIVSNFGRALAELNMLNYTEKVWGLPCSKISPDWAKQRIKGLSLKEVIKKAVIKSKSGPKTLVDQFYYPDTGAGLIYEKIKEKILSENSGDILLKTYPVKIIHNDNKITKVVVNTNNKNRTIKSKFIISSIPITEFVNLLEPKAPNEVLQAIKNLKFRSHVSLFITLNKPFVFSDQWIYFPDKKIPFGRIMEPKNFSKKMSPPDKTSLLIEFFCWKNDNIWNANKKQLFELSIKWLERFGLIKREEVINCFVHKEKYAYPVYDLNYKKHLRKVKDYLKQFNNLQLIGRAGSFRYNNQDHALEMGILAARSIIEEKQYNIEDVGAEQKYFERGYVR